MQFATLVRRLRLATVGSSCFVLCLVKIAESIGQPHFNSLSDGSTLELVRCTSQDRRKRRCLWGHRPKLQIVSNFGELSVRFGTDRFDGRQANYDDQSHHDRVLNSSWSVFFFQKVNYFFSEFLHCNFSYQDMAKATGIKQLVAPTRHNPLQPPVSSINLRRHTRENHSGKSLSIPILDPGRSGIPNSGSRNLASRPITRDAIITGAFGRLEIIVRALTL